MQRRLPIILLVILLVVTAIRCARLLDGGIATGDEALTALRSLGLLEKGHSWTPYWNGEPDVHKPPLYYWMVAVGYSMLGVGELAVRLPSVLALLCLLVLTCRLGSLVFDTWTGLLAALLVALHPTLLAQSCVGMLDTTMIALSLGAAVFLLLSDDQPRSFLGWGLCCGLALLTKGEGAVPILPVSFLFLLLARRGAFRQPLLYAGLALAAVIAGAWFGSQFFLHHDIFLKPHYQDFVDYRFKHSWRDMALYLKSLRYLWASWGGLAPFLAAAPVLVLLDFHGVMRKRKGAGGFAAETWFDRRQYAAVLIVLLGVVPLVMVSVVRQQKPWYMLPAIAPMALFAARSVVSGFQARRALAGRVLPGLLLALGMMLPGVSAGPSGFPWLALGLSAASVLAGFRATPALQRAGAALFAGALAASAAASLSIANPHVNLVRRNDPTDIRRLAEMLPAKEDVPGPMVVNFRHYPLNTLMFYARRDSVQLRDFSSQPVAPNARFVGVLSGGGSREFLSELEVRSAGAHAGHEILVLRNPAGEAVVPASASGAPSAPGTGASGEQERGPPARGWRGR